MEGPHEVGWRPSMPASTLSRRSIALLRVNLGTGLRKADPFPTEIAQEPYTAFHGCAEKCANPPSHRLRSGDVGGPAILRRTVRAFYYQPTQSASFSQAYLL